MHLSGSTKAAKQKSTTDASQAPRGAMIGLQCNTSSDQPLPEPSEPEMMDISMTSTLSGMGNILDTTLLGLEPGELSDLEASYKGDSSSKVGGDVDCHLYV